MIVLLFGPVYNAMFDPVCNAMKLNTDSKASLAIQAQRITVYIDEMSEPLQQLFFGVKLRGKANCEHSCIGRKPAQNL